MSPVTMKRLGTRTSVCLTVLVLAPRATGMVIEVRSDGSGDYATIQAAIDATSNGDEIVLRTGVYTGDGNRDITYRGKALTVRSLNPADGDIVSATIIDCQGSESDPHRGFRFDSHEGAGSVLAGLLVRNGFGAIEVFGTEAVSVGGAVLCLGGAGPTILGCQFVGNYAVGGDGAGTGEPGFGGGAVYCRAGSPRVERCLFEGNSTGDDGGGLSFYGGAPVIRYCTIMNNTAGDAGGGIYCRDGCHLTIDNVVINGNASGFWGGGVYVRINSGVNFVNCTVVDNSSQRGGALRIGPGASADLINSILWGNTAPTEPQIAKYQTGTAALTYTDIQGGWSGTGNIDGDPRFRDPDGPDDDANTFADNDYRLSSGSPCIDAGSNGAVPADASDLDDDGDTTEPIPWDLDGHPRFVDDVGMPDTGMGPPPIVDMGAYEFQGTTPYLTASAPAHQGTLWRTAKNIIRLTFDQDLAAAPAAGQIVIQELLAGGGFGPDLAAGFTFTIDTDPKVLKIRETATSLTHRKWYAIRNTGGWTGVANFEVQYVVLMGDVDNNGFVQNLDAGAIYPNVSPLPKPDDYRYDVDGNGFCQNLDAGGVFPRVSPLPKPTKPSGH